MHFLLKESTVDAIIRYRKYLIATGTVLLVQPFILPRGWGFGLLLGFMLWALGIFASGLQRWRTEPGLWMLALVVLVPWGVGYCFFEYKHIAALIEHWRNGGQLDGKQIRILIEVVLGLSLMWTTVQFALTVAIENLRRTRAPGASK